MKNAERALVGTVIICLALALGGFMLAKVCWNKYQQGCASASWPATEGRIVTSEKKWVTNSRGNEVSPKVEYEYAVDGRKYIGTTITFKSQQAGSGYSTLGKYPRWKKVRVSYNPANAGVSVLEPGGDKVMLVAVALGALLALIALAHLVCVALGAAGVKRFAPSLARSDADDDRRQPGKLAFVRGFSQGVDSPDGRYTATFGTSSGETPVKKLGAVYECSVEMEVPDGLLVLFSTTIGHDKALPDLRHRKDIVKWAPDSATVTFMVAREPIVVNVKELAARERQA